jgi:hypothetical protein
MTYIKQNDLLLNKLLEYYTKNDNMNKMLGIINGESRISLRIVDWFATNFAKKYFTVYNITNNKVNNSKNENENKNENDTAKRFKVYVDYKLNLKAYSKRRFDPFCRWERITVPYEHDKFIQTTIGQLNFFKWALENRVIEYIENNYSDIESDMNSRNSTSKRKTNNAQKTRKKREELSISATKSIKREEVAIIVEFN